MRFRFLGFIPPCIKMEMVKKMHKNPSGFPMVPSLYEGMMIELRPTLLPLGLAAPERHRTHPAMAIVSPDHRHEVACLQN